MEKLEKKIEEILDGYMPHNGACIEASFLIAQEVKDIAIAFALHYAAEDINIDAGQSFTSFLTTYYKK